MTSELTNLLLAGACFVAILATAEGARALGTPAEWTRKWVHLLSGLVAASFPWLFAHASSVALLSGSYVLLMAASRRHGLLASVHGVTRPTAGGYFYPPAVALVFALAADRPYAYLPAILTLAIGDAAAALVGRAWGRRRYRALGATRSLEGSLALAVAAYPCVHVPLALFGPALGTLECVAWSLHLAVLAALVEAVAPHGSDNLLVPAVVAVPLLYATSGRAPWAALAATLALAGVAAAAVVRHQPARLRWAPLGLRPRGAVQA